MRNMLQINIDMEMPNKCGECKFASAYDCKISGKFIEDHDAIPEHCPLKKKDTFTDLLQELKKEIRKERVSIALQYDDSLHFGSNYICDIIDRIMGNH